MTRSRIANARRAATRLNAAREVLNKSFDKLRTNDKLLIPFVVSLSNHERNQLVRRFPQTSNRSASTP